MIRTATPGEIVRWRRDLAPLPPDRRDAVIDLLAEVVADCPVCEEPVRRCDPRALRDGHLAHLRCAGEPQPRRAGAAEIARAK